MTVNLVGVVLAVAAVVAVTSNLWGPRQTTEAWAKGAEGERRTGRLLAELPTDSFVVLHDLRIPGQRVVEQAQRQADVVRQIVGHDVSPVVCVHGGGVRVEGWRTRPVGDSVRFCSGRRLIEVLTVGSPILGVEGVRDTAALLEAGLPRPRRSGTPGQHGPDS